MMMAHDMPPTMTVHPALALPDAADEANHRVANHLQLLAALISVEARAVRDAESRAVLERTQHRLAAVSGVHRQLYMVGGAVVDLGAYLIELGEQLAGSGPSYRQILINAASVLVPASAATAIGVLATELATNACKYAYGAGEPGDVVIELAQVENGLVSFSVEDRGRGRCAESFKAGLGSRLVDATVRKLGGSAIFEDACPGTRFRMIFSL